MEEVRVAQAVINFKINSALRKYVCDNAKGFIVLSGIQSGYFTQYLYNDVCLILYLLQIFLKFRFVL